MKCGAVIIDNRPIDLNWLFEFKLKIPRDWGYMCIKNHGVRTLNDYNKLMTSRHLWESIPFDKVLIFQQDSDLLRPGVEEFLEWDYIGAPWQFQQHGGNGGLSLRSKEMMLRIIDGKPYEGPGVDGYEDVYFSNNMERFGGKLAPREICKKFSVESIFELGTLGYHAIDKYLNHDQVKQIKTQYLCAL